MDRNKLLAVITFLTISFPQWFDTLPLEVKPTTKEMVHWIFKGVDLIMCCYTLAQGYNYKSYFFNNTDTQ